MTKVVLTGFNKMVQKAKQIKKYVMPRAYDYFKRITPIDTGNARRSTILRNHVIYAKYKYAYVLDKGRHFDRGARGSNQAPDGMTEPTIDLMIDHVNDYIRKL